MSILPDNILSEDNSFHLNSTHQNETETASIDSPIQNPLQYFLQHVNLDYIPTLSGFQNSESITFNGFVIFQNVARTVSKLEKAVDDLKMKNEGLEKRQKEWGEQKKKMLDQKRLWVEQKQKLSEQNKCLFTQNKKLKEQSKKLYDMNMCLEIEMSKIKEVSKSFQDGSLEEHKQSKREVPKHSQLQQSLYLLNEKNPWKFEELPKKSSLIPIKKSSSQSQTPKNSPNQIQINQTIIKVLAEKVMKLQTENEKLRNLMSAQNDISKCSENRGSFSHPEILRLLSQIQK